MAKRLPKEPCHVGLVNVLVLDAGVDEETVEAVVEALGLFEICGMG